MSIFSFSVIAANVTVTFFAPRIKKSLGRKGSGLRRIRKFFK